MRPPRRRLAPRDRNHQAAPPRPWGGGTRGPEGDCGEPPLPPTPPPPPRPVSGRRAAGETVAPHPPEGAAAPRGGTPRPRLAQPRAKHPQSTARSLPHCPLPTSSSARAPWAATDRNGGTQEYADAAARLGGRPGRAGEQTTAKRPLPPPPTTLLHRRPTRPRPAPTAARQPRRNVGVCAGEKEGHGGHGLPHKGGGLGNSGAGPLLSPPHSPPGLWAKGGPALQPPRGRGDVPPPPEGT